MAKAQGSSDAGSINKHGTLVGAMLVYGEDQNGFTDLWLRYKIGDRIQQVQEVDAFHCRNRENLV